MSKRHTKAAKSKRQVIREERERKARQTRLITIGAILLIVAVLIGVIVFPSIQEANKPIGDFTVITPVSRELVDGTKIGNPQASVEIQLFEDFKCSACQSYSQFVEPEVISKIVDTGKAYYVFHQYPFLDDRSAIKDSDKAAMASECAAEQNRFWDYKDMLYANFNGISGEFSDQRLFAFAETIDLDTNQFDDCFKQKLYQDKINQDIALGQQLGVSGTPSVFVNGQNVSPGKVPTFEQILSLVEEALSSSSN